MMKNLMLYKNRQTGMTLVELMVAMTLSLVLLAGVVQVFISSKQSYRLNDAMSRVQENGRFAINFLTKDIRMAGFYGCATNALAFPNVIVNNGSPIDFGQGAINGTDGAGLNGSDTIILSGAYDSGIFVDEPYMNTNSSALHLPVGNGLAVSDIVMVSDCSSSDVFQITGPTDPDTSGTLNHNTGNSVFPSNGFGGDLSKMYAGDASVFRMVQKTYFLSAGASGEPALFLNTNGVSVELVEGVENMQILYGEDTGTLDNIANIYRPANNVANWENVVSVRISLLLRTIEDNMAPQAVAYFYNGANNAGDQRLRRVFTTTINIRNRTL